MRLSGTSNRIFKTFVGCAILFLLMTIAHMIYQIRHNQCPESLRFNGKTEVCK